MPSREKKVLSAPICIARGVLASVLAALGMAAGFACLVLAMDLDSAVIVPVNQVIKVLSILIGSFAASGGRVRAWIAGMSVGGLFMLLGVVLYCAFAGKTVPLAAAAGDVGMGLAAGLICGLMVRSIKRR